MKSLIERGEGCDATTRQSERELEASFTAGISAFEFSGQGIRTGLVGEEVARRVYDRLQKFLPGRIRQFKVCVSENSVILTGLCGSFYTKQLAQHEAREALQTERLINNLVVIPSK